MSRHQEEHQSVQKPGKQFQTLYWHEKISMFLEKPEQSTEEAMAEWR